ncbi:MAG: hypothetical protein KKG47_16400 [Proteobacteria bacterium]|nr:hypothetical protein [Pseudomonadota bacterium]MBU1739676.1 hypothetical protein [Pseudomonadota bacterium]
MKTLRHNLIRTILALTALLANLSIPGHAVSEELASGRYLSGSGARIEVELDISTPAPPLVIVIQNLPPGTRVTDSTPELMKYDADKGVAKWLLRGLKPGKFRITMQLDRSLHQGEVSGEIRCRDSGGNMVNRKISGN